MKTIVDKKMLGDYFPSVVFAEAQFMCSLLNIEDKKEDIEEQLSNTSTLEEVDDILLKYFGDELKIRH